MGYNDILIIASKKIITIKQMEEITKKVNEVIEAEVLTAV